jgi:hypothetical protein
MKASVLALVLLVPAVAAAQPGVPADPAYLAKLLRSGQIASEQGKCRTVDSIGAKVAELDADYHANVYRTDAIIATCMEGIDRRQRPPSSLDPAVTDALPPFAERASGVRGEKSESTAVALSLGGTLLSYALVYASSESDTGDEAMATVGMLGTVFAPSFGHWYAGKFATTGLGMRGAALGVGMTALVWTVSECPLFSSEDECNHTIGPAVLAVGAVGLWVVGTIGDISKAPDAVRAYNRSLQDSLSIVPVVRDDGATVSVAGSF